MTGWKSILKAKEFSFSLWSVMTPTTYTHSHLYLNFTILALRWLVITPTTGQ